MTIILKSPGFNPERVSRSVLRILRSTQLWSMATRNNFGSHISTAYFCYSDTLDFYFLSDSKTHHIRNIVQLPRVAVAVFDSRQTWNADHRGLQLFGTCKRTTTSEAATAIATYSRRFPAYAAYLKKQSPKELRLSPYRFYVFRPERLKLLDERTFGEEVFVSATVVRLK